MLLVIGLLAAYQVAFGIEGISTLPITAYTIAFGVLLVAGLLLIILGFEVLDSPIIVIASTITPLSLATGLVWEHLASYRTLYLVSAIVGFLAVTLTRLIPTPGKTPTIILALVHGIAGMTISLLPIILSIQGQTQPPFSLIGIGGAGTTCVATNPTGFGESMAPLAKFHWLYVLFVLAGLAIGVWGIRATIKLVKGTSDSYWTTIKALVAGVAVGGFHIYASRMLRGKSMPVDAVVYTTILTFAVFLIFRIPGIWQGVNFDKGSNNGNTGGLAAAITLILVGISILALPFMMAKAPPKNNFSILRIYLCGIIV